MALTMVYFSQLRLGNLLKVNSSLLTEVKHATCQTAISVSTPFLFIYI